LSSDGARGRIIEMDGSGFREAGALLKQDQAALTAANPSGSYAFGLDADPSLGGSTRTVEIGRFTLGTTGNVTGGIMDLGKAEALTPVLTDQSFGATAGTAPDPLGRGLFTLSVTVSSQTYNAQYAYYVVNSDQLFIIETDNGWQYATAQAGTARLQQGLGSASDVNGTSVLQLTGIDVSSGPPAYPEPLNVIGPHVLIGQMLISGGNSVSLTFDTNDLGVVATQLTIPNASLAGSVPGVVGYDPTTGRGTITISFGYDQGFVNSAVFYLYAPNSGFMIDADPSPTTAPPALAVTNQGYSGTFVPQQPNPGVFTFLSNMIAYTGASSTPGFNNSTTLMGSPPIPDVPVMEGIASLNKDGTERFTVQLGSVVSGNFVDLALTGSFGGGTDSTGHTMGFIPQVFTGDTTANGYNQIFGSLYAIAPDQFVMISNLSGRMSGVMFFDPQ